MLDHRIVSLQNLVLVPVARVLAQKGVRADTLSWIGLGFAILAFLLISANWYLAGLAAVAANRVVDGLDGSVARATRPTDKGAFLDISLDFVFYAVVPLAFALANPAANALAAAVLIASFVGTGTSFLAFSLLAERKGLRSTKFPAKGIYYVGALAEGAETIAVFVAMCLFPGVLRRDRLWLRRPLYGDHCLALEARAGRPLKRSDLSSVRYQSRCRLSGAVQVGSGAWAEAGLDRGYPLSRRRHSKGDPGHEGTAKTLSRRLRHQRDASRHLDPRAPVLASLLGSVRDAPSGSPN